MDNKNSNSIRKVGKSIWETLNAFLLTQELRCMLFWGFFRGVFSDICPGQDDDYCWRIDKSACDDPFQKFTLRTSCPVLCGLCPATSTWGVFTLPRYFHLRSLYSARYFHLRSLYSAPLLPFEKSLLCPATSTWEVFTLPRYFHLRSLYSAPLLPLEESLL